MNEQVIRWLASMPKLEISLDIRQYLSGMIKSLFSSLFQQIVSWAEAKSSGIIRVVTMQKQRQNFRTRMRTHEYTLRFCLTTFPFYVCNLRRSRSWGWGWRWRGRTWSRTSPSNTGGRCPRWGCSRLPCLGSARWWCGGGPFFLNIFWISSWLFWISHDGKGFDDWEATAQQPLPP